MSTSRWLAAGLACVVAGGVLGYCARGGSGAEAEKARADSLVQVADSLDRIARGWADSVAHVDSVARLDSIARSGVLDSLQARAKASEALAANLSGRLRATLDSAQRIVHDSLEAAHASTLAAKDSVIAEKDAEAASLRDRLRVRDTRIHALVETVAAKDSAIAAKDAVIEKLDRKGVNLGLFRVPTWVGYVAALGGGVYIGTRF